MKLVGNFYNMVMVGDRDRVEEEKVGEYIDGWEGNDKVRIEKEKEIKDII